MWVGGGNFRLAGQGMLSPAVGLGLPTIRERAEDRGKLWVLIMSTS